jgi:hypothetical protein
LLRALAALAFWVAAWPAAARASEPAPTPRAAEPAPAARASEPAPAGGPVGGQEIEGPMRPDAQALYDRGLARFQTHDYENATRDFEAGYAIEPRPEFLFAEGQARRLAGNCKAAVALYQRFLATGPPAVQVNATHMALGRCAQVLAEHPDVVLVTPPPPRPPPPTPRRWWRDPFGLAATGAGAIGVGLGVGFLVAASSAEQTANASSTHPEYASAWSTAQSRQTIGVTAIVVGGALAGAGAVRLVLLRRQATRQGQLFVVSLGPGAVLLGGGF